MNFELSELFAEVIISFIIDFGFFRTHDLLPGGNCAYSRAVRFAS